MLENQYIKKMAIGIENFDNINPADADYPNGDIKDNTGMMDGTPFDRKGYGDIHQFFDKARRITGIVANGNPDNESNGFQNIDAVKGIANGYGIRTLFDRTTSQIDVSGRRSPLIVTTGGLSDLGELTLIESTDPIARDGEKITIVNFSDNPLNVNASSAGSDTIDDGGTLTIGLGETIELTLDKSNANWIVLKRPIRYSQRIEFDATAPKKLVPTRVPQLVMIRTLGSSDPLSIEDSTLVPDLAVIKIVNLSGGAVDLVRESTSDKINGASASYSMANGARLEFTLNKATKDYEITGN